MIVKVCGMREPENIRAVERSGADWMGFIFFPRSPRYVEVRPDYLPQQCKRVGVFVNERTETILQKAEEFGLHVLQLHGNETPQQCSELKACGLEIIKAFSIREVEDLQPADAYEGACNYFLFDTACSGYGGSGTSFDWNLLTCYKGTTPFLLAGGIGPDSMTTLKHFHHPAWIGIDLNSGFETAPAQKDATLLHTFIKPLKQQIQ